MVVRLNFFGRLGYLIVDLALSQLICHGHFYRGRKNRVVYATIKCMKAISEIRPSPIAGRWYSGDPRELSQTIDSYLEAAQNPTLDGSVTALIVPHAGHPYSGPVAAYAFKTVVGLKFDLVAVVSPMHQYHPSPLLTSAHQAYATPLGIVPINGDAVAEVNAALEAGLGFGLSPVAYDGEHSLEIELPFLQRVLSGPFELLPIMMRDQSPMAAQGVGQALAKTLAGRSALLVASSDLSHFNPQQMAARFDAAILEQVANFSPDGLFAVEAQGKGFACGLAAMAAVLWAARDLGATRAQVLHYATSGDVIKDFSSVVGYGAAVVLKKEK
jgi:MEMO1 family protein